MKKKDTLLSSVHVNFVQSKIKELHCMLALCLALSSHGLFKILVHEQEHSNTYTVPFKIWNSFDVKNQNGRNFQNKNTRHQPYTFQMIRHVNDLSSQCEH